VSTNPLRIIPPTLASVNKLGDLSKGIYDGVMADMSSKRRREGLGLKEFLLSAWHTLKLARKSGREEFLLYLKLVFLGLFIVGSIGFLIQFVGALIKLG